MKQVSGGEWRYAVLLILLLIIAAVASVQTVTHVDQLIRDAHRDEAIRRLQGFVLQEQRKLADLVHYAANARAFSGMTADAFMDRVLQVEDVSRLNLSAAALVAADGSLLSYRALSPAVVAAGVAPRAYCSWSNAVPASSQVSTEVGFCRSPQGVSLLALARVLTEGSSSNAPYLMLVRPLDRKYIRTVQENYPAFSGIVGPNERSEVTGETVPIEGMTGNRVGFFVVELDLEWTEKVSRHITVAIHLLTMGFILLAGAMGLWAIRSTVIVEAQRRLGRFVDAMDYLRDGLVMLDKKGRVTGSNPSARAMTAHAPEKRATLGELFPILEQNEVELLRDASRPREVEKPVPGERRQRIWRFRSQPSADVDLILISDVTNEKMAEMRRRQAAVLQLIGRIARGVAHDFNNILCAVGGHASLLQLPESASPEERESLRAIVQESERGAELAAHLLELSRTREGEQPTEQIGDHVRKAADLLKVGLSSAWSVDLDMDQIVRPVPLSSMQVEQAVLNLGLLAADELPQPGVLRIRVREPSAELLSDPLGERWAAVISIVTQDADAAGVTDSGDVEMQTTDEEAGAIQSVVRTMLEEVRGRLEVFLRRGRHVYRMYLPEIESNAGEEGARGESMPEELARYVADWRILVAMPASNASRLLKERLNALGSGIEAVEDLVSTLARVDSGEEFNAMILNKQLLGAEADGLLRAILKLRPSTALVVLCESEEEETPALAGKVVFCRSASSPDDILEAMLKAREMASRRRGDF